MTDVQTAEKILTGLRRKHEACVTHTLALAEDRQRLSFSAHGDGDVAAQKRLSELNRASTTAALELENIDAALVEANTRLEVARRQADIAADQARAHELRKVLGEFVESGGKLDEAMAALVAECGALKDLLAKLHRLGAGVPTHGQLDALGHHALLTALGQTLWRRRFETLAPNQRRTFGDLFDGWAATVERDIAARLGEADVEEAA
jgi:hypothetical protein